MSREDLPDWLLFSPLSSEGRLPALGHLSGISPATSFVDVVKGMGKAPTDAKGMAPLHPEGPSAPLPDVGPSRRQVS
jgi:hypothetical protein